MGLSIFLDVDGVLSDVVTPAFAAHGRPDLTQHDCDRWDLHEIVGVEAREFWQNPTVITEEFWATLPELPWARDLVRMVQGKGEVSFLTTAIKSPACLAGKQRWLQERWPDIPYFICNKKVLVAGDGRLLVDDYAENVKGWVSRGGWGVLFPAPWNGGALEDPVSWLEAQLL